MFEGKVLKKDLNSGSLGSYQRRVVSVSASIFSVCVKMVVM
jgi:hypothetical protein